MLFQKMGMYKGEKERAGPITLFSTFSVFGGEFLDPLYTRSISGTTYIIIYKIIIII